VTEADFLGALRGRLPANLASLPFRSSNSNFTFAQLAGLDTIVAKLRRLLIHPYLNPELYAAQQKRLGISPPMGVLLHGPPGKKIRSLVSLVALGTGKTSLALAVASECKMNLLVVHGAQLIAKHVGDSEKAIASLFTHARSSAPCLIVIDQFEVFAPKRSGGGGSADRVLSCFLTELNGITSRSDSPEQQVILVATTSVPELLDPAVMRPGFFVVSMFVAVTKILRSSGRTNLRFPSRPRGPQSHLAAPPFPHVVGSADRSTLSCPSLGRIYHGIIRVEQRTSNSKMDMRN